MIEKNKKGLVIGTGSIGLRHYKIISKLLSFDTYIKSSSSKREIDLKNRGYKIFNKDLNYDFGIIATTSDKHMSTYLKYGNLCPIWLIEKPIVSIYNLFPSLKIDKKEKDKLFVGYNKRFEKGILKLKKIIENKSILSANFTCLSDLGKWRKQPISQSISLDRNRGGGVLNELSHEIDLASFLLGTIENITGEVFQKKYTFTQVEDSAFLYIKHKYGKTSKVNISFASSFDKRIIEVKTTDGIFKYNHHTGDISLRKSEHSKQILLINTKEERDLSFKRQAEALIYNNYENLCTFEKGLDLIEKIHYLRWQ
tara:strand:+ start:2593 stop:3525 length:933 start_codon:yes stop_codon:yes gene_type:complete